MLIPMTSQPQTGRTERVAVVTRQAASADIAAAAALAMLHSGDDLAGWSERLREDLAACDRLLVVGERDEVVAYGRVRRFQAPADAPANVAPDGYYLSGLVVSPAHRGHGIGRAITQARLAWIAGRATEAWYFTNARNQRSLRLHQELGFREITRGFVFPGVHFAGGTGVLSRVTLANRLGPQL